MSENVNTIDQVRSNVDPSAVLSLIGAKNTPLADQFQFSSLLKTFVETPQEALSAVQDNKKPFDRHDIAKKFDNFGDKNDLHDNRGDSLIHGSEPRS